MLPLKIKAMVYCLKSNSHGPNSETIHGWKVQRIRGMQKGYFRLMLYAPSGKCWSLDIYKPTSKPERSV